MIDNSRKVVTIDGPAGAGKSTLAKALAKHLNWTYLDTGALYRALAFTASQRGLDCHDRAAAEALAENICLSANLRPEGTVIMVDGEDVTDLLRSSDVSRNAAAISAWPGVRQSLLGIQRAIGNRGEVVAEGRDMGTVIFPHAGLKIFLLASPEARAARREKDLREKGETVSYDQILKAISARDEADSSRDVAPLVAAPDAVIIDSTALEIEEVLKIMIEAYSNNFNSQPA